MKNWNTVKNIHSRYYSTINSICKKQKPKVKVMSAENSAERGLAFCTLIFAL